MDVRIKSSIFNPSDFIPILAFDHKFKTSCKSNGIHEKPQCGSSHTSWKSRSGTLYHIKRMPKKQHYSKRRNVDNPLSSCQLSLRNLHNWYSHCRSWEWHHEIQVVRKYIRHPLLGDALGEGIEMWTSLRKIKTEECVHRWTTPLDSLLYENLLGCQQTCHLVDFTTLRHLLFSIRNRYLPQVALLLRLEIAVGNSHWKVSIWNDARPPWCQSLISTR